MRDTIGIDFREFDIAMIKIHTETGYLVQTIIREQKALWAKDLLKSTIPTGKFGGTGSDFQIGKRAVYTDLDKIFIPLTVELSLLSWAKDNSAGTVIYRRTKSGNLMKINKELLHMTMDGWHSQHRNKTTGRTWLQKDRNYAWGGMMPVPERAFNRFVQEKQAHVGRTKSGWVPAVRYFCSKTLGRVRSIIPVWVFRHQSFGQRFGGFGENYDLKHLSGYAESTNSVPWLRDDGMLEATKRTRLADLNNGWYVKRLDRILKKYEYKRAA